jgi:hypothetical protein
MKELNTQPVMDLMRFYDANWKNYVPEMPC